MAAASDGSFNSRTGCKETRVALKHSFSRRTSVRVESQAPETGGRPRDLWNRDWGKTMVADAAVPEREARGTTKAGRRGRGVLQY